MSNLTFHLAIVTLSLKVLCGLYLGNIRYKKLIVWIMNRGIGVQI